MVNLHDNVASQIRRTPNKNSLLKYLKYSSILLMSVIFGVAIMFWGKYLKANKELKAANRMFMAVNNFELDKFDDALHGAESYYGLLEFIEKYKGTKAATLACFYVGTIYMNKGDYDNAIKFLTQFKTEDFVLRSRAMALIGDAYVQNGDYGLAIKHFDSAINSHPNEWFTPRYLHKKALACKKLNNYVAAIECYKKLVQDFPTSTLADDAVKYIANLEGLIAKGAK
jgi:tetratricopeptide (TPR) repeat protein